jgi:hypothetical protein
VRDLESEVEAKCGEWTECGAVVCRADYGGYCLARRAFDGKAVSTAMWGYKRIMYSENADLEAVLIEVAAAIPAPDLQKVFDWIQAKTVESRIDYCWKQTYTRPATIVPGRVPDCPAEYHNMGLSCHRLVDSFPADSYVADCPAGTSD